MIADTNGNRVVRETASTSNGVTTYVQSIVADGSPAGPSDVQDSSTATPELGSSELVATGLVPLGLAILYRRRRTRHDVNSAEGVTSDQS